MLAGGDARRQERPGDGRPGAVSLEMLIVRIQLPTTAERRETRQRAEGDRGEEVDSGGVVAREARRHMERPGVRRPGATVTIVWIWPPSKAEMTFNQNRGKSHQGGPPYATPSAK